MRWANILSQFHFQIVHVQGQKNVVADALSQKLLVQAISAIHHSSFEDMVDQYATDTDFADIFTRIRDGEIVAGYSIREGYLMRKTMLCVTQSLREKVMTECHCPPYTGHRGIATTMKGVERYFYWPRLKKDVEEFVRSCLVCQKVKFDRHKEQGLLQPLPIPTRPWESIAMDFIFDLPRTQSGHDGIWTIIDRFSKQAHFIPVKKTVKSDHLARLFVAQIFRLHGMPETIVSDRDPRFTSLFWKAIWENIVQIEPFIDLSKACIFTSARRIRSLKPTNIPGRDLDTASAKVCETLQKSQERQRKAADRHRRDLKLKENDWVLLRFEKARLRKKKGKERLFPKLSMRYYGPFQITERINDVSFRLRLLDTWKIHNAFHVSLLKPFKGDVPDDGEPDEQPEVEENEEILVPEQILAHKDTKNKGLISCVSSTTNLEGDFADLVQVFSAIVSFFGDILAGITGNVITDIFFARQRAIHEAQDADATVDVTVDVDPEGVIFDDAFACVYLVVSSILYERRILHHRQFLVSHTAFGIPCSQYLAGHTNVAKKIERLLRGGVWKWVVAPTPRIVATIHVYNIAV
ncbi:hypothetical protein L7F22_000372 [Adiantum nelumboides]|nr:hypothetical protein [Adiantum nelumboides]